MQTRVVLETGFFWKRAFSRAAAWVNHYGKDGFGIKSFEVSRPEGGGLWGFIPGRIIVLAILTNPPPKEEMPEEGE